MSHDHGSKKAGPIRFLFENSIFLIAGAIAALLWANTNPGTYHRLVEFPLNTLWEDADHDDKSHHAADHSQGESEAAHEEQALAHTITVEHAEEHDEEHAAHGYTFVLPFGFELPFAHGFTPLALINDLFMALFFAIAAKEVWEALLPGGALSNPRKAATPLLATLGGIVGPAGIYAVGVLLFSTWGELGNGWAVPCATDIAFSYLVARLIFGAGHPAIAFLLLLAIADDAAGLVILAVFYPSGALEPQWLLLSVAAIALGFAFQKMKLQSFWWYLLIPGVMSWIGFLKSGIHPALGLVPIIPIIPHAKTDLGIFAREELGRDDALNAFEHWWKNPVELILGLFGLVNAGVGFGSVGTGTWLVLAGLLIGKPLGITLFTWIAEKWFKLEIPGGMGYRHIVTLGMVAGIGFTVALFVSTAAFPVGKFPQTTLDAVKMGALGSFFAAVLAIVGARMLGVRPLVPDDPMEVSEPGVDGKDTDETMPAMAEATT